MWQKHLGSSSRPSEGGGDRTRVCVEAASAVFGLVNSSPSRAPRNPISLLLYYTVSYPFHHLIISPDDSAYSSYNDKQTRRALYPRAPAVSHMLIFTHLHHHIARRCSIPCVHLNSAMCALLNVIESSRPCVLESPFPRALSLSPLPLVVLGCRVLAFLSDSSCVIASRSCPDLSSKLGTQAHIDSEMLVRLMKAQAVEICSYKIR